MLEKHVIHQNRGSTDIFRLDSSIIVILRVIGQVMLLLYIVCV